MNSYDLKIEELNNIIRRKEDVEDQLRMARENESKIYESKQTLQFELRQEKT